ncbi:MAG: hypothetical protein ACRD04_08835 [Terriglobales bacterium]
MKRFAILIGLAFVARTPAAQLRARRGPPLQATAVVTVTRVNAGHRTTRRLHILLARDAEGRTRAVRELGVASAAAAYHVIEIHDPEAKTILILYPEQHAAILRATDREVAAATPWPAAEDWPGTPVLDSVTETDLGRRPLAGIAAQGQRRSGPLRWQTGTGSIELWTGAGMDLWTRQSDSHGNEREFKVTTVQLGAPPAALFRLPAGYTVSDRRPTVARRLELFAEARHGATALAGIGGAYVWAQIADDELAANLDDAAERRQARADAVGAMRRLVALHGDDLLRRYRDQTEVRLITALTGTPLRPPSAVDLDTALAMVRTADAPRGYLYDRLLTSWSRSDQPPDWNPLALLRECLAADGTFPYGGAAAIAAHPANASAPSAVQAAVLRLAYATAAGARNRVQAQGALGFLDDMQSLITAAPAPWFAATDWRRQWSQAAAAVLGLSSQDDIEAHEVFLSWQALAPRPAAAWLAAHPDLRQFAQTSFCRDTEDGCGEERPAPAPPRPAALTPRLRFWLLQMQAPQDCGAALDAYALATASPRAAGPFGPEMNLGYVLEGCGREDLAEALWGRQLSSDLALAAKQDARFAAVQAVYAPGGDVWANVPGGWMLSDFQFDAQADFDRTVAAVERLHAPVAQPLILAAIAAGAR